MTSPHRTPLPFTWHQKHSRSLTFGERAADVLRNSMGSWRFVFGFVAFMLVWAIVNSFAAGWDEYPFILLNLFLSMLAGLQGAILLIAAKRQDGIAAALSQHDFETDVTARADIEVLLAINREQALLLEEMRGILRRLDERALPAVL
ncbi:DUF1003 domain-containing protein [Rathayibacter caricis]|uniref:DUF1003 domain-containing protein n=1 Tax=Rathayibacter caricis TaxID=110936 RepID=UPI001FB433BE|nr:DUF1003 domain-containing protein [Rathayibacter caricis]MCJ1696562.1 DUF1003 domain-containing protein [Rathayibacter caricis]